jgi:hypothetical protein
MQHNVQGTRLESASWHEAQCVPAKYHLESITYESPEGRINLSSPDHVSLLVHRTFNVSIPRQHLPFDEYEFEYGLEENDPEFGNRIDSEALPLAPGDEPGVRDPGRWVHQRTGFPLGGVERTIEFTIIGCVERLPVQDTRGHAQKPTVRFFMHRNQY